MSEFEQHFAYHRAVAPLLWAFVCVASVELIVVHLLLGLWRLWLAVAVSLLTVAGIIWLVTVILSMRRLPVLLDAERLVMRVGTLKSVTIDRRHIAGLRHAWTAAEVKQRHVLNLALIAYPNVIVELTEPLPGRRGVRSVAHRLDDPNAFATALAGSDRTVDDERAVLRGGTVPA